VAIPGHSVGQIGVTLLLDDVTLFFVADHILSQAWFLEDLEADRITMVSKAGAPKRAAETTRRIRQFVEERPCILLPAHDTEASARLDALQPLAL
jgi:glyoxylase-like metal-dependent hydrolase (beta-lactamase superfamily II)